MEKSSLISILNILAILLTCIHLSCSDSNSATKPNAGSITGMFVFGDSTVDNGNNNFLMSSFKSNYLPYGIDLPSGPTGRFTDAKNLADLIGDHLMLPLLPSFSDPNTTGVRISRGVNHGSAGSGILESTGSKMGVKGLNQQVRDFMEVTLPMLKSEQGSPRTNSTKLLEQYLFLFSTGSNDYLEDFFQGGSNIGNLVFFTANLTSTLAGQLSKLYNAGARKFAFIGIGPIGCTPMARAAVSNKSCNETLNSAAYLFNEMLIDKLNAIKSRVPQFQFVVVNFFQIGLEFIQFPSLGGFTDASNSCCEVPIQSGGVLCKQGGKVCANRSKYLFFDGLHPTQAFYSIVATRAYNSSNPTEVYPFNIQKLAQL